MTSSKKVTGVILAICIVFCGAIALAGCSSNSSSSNNSSSTSSSEVKEVTMTEEAVSTLKDEVGKDDVVFLDVRKAEDYKAGHIIGAVNADMDKAKDGDNENGKSTMEAAIKDNNLKSQKLVLVCYSGKKYAQAGTNILSALGYDMSKVVTLQGGMKAWTEGGNSTVS